MDRMIGKLIHHESLTRFSEFCRMSTVIHRGDENGTPGFEKPGYPGENLMNEVGLCNSLLNPLK